MKRLLLALLALPLAAFAQTSNVPNYISYQGKITDASGTPVGNTAPVNRTVIFRIWNSATETAAANRLYSEQQNVTISGGEFSVLIGAGTPVTGETTNAYTIFSSAIFAGATRYLGVTVDDGDLNLTNDPESSPRQQMVSSVFALRAQTAESVANGGITGPALANGSVGSSALAASAVVTDALATDSVTAAKLAAGAVIESKIGTGAVIESKIGTGAVTEVKLGTGAVTVTKLADTAVTNAKLADSAVNSAKISDGSIDTVDLKDSSVTADKLAAGAVLEGKLGTGAVTEGKLGTGAVTVGKLADGAVTSAKILNGSITRDDLSTSVQNQLPKDRDIYNQGISTSVDPAGPTLIPIELGDLGRDDDGCRIQIIAFHKSSTASDSTILTEIRLFLQQPGWYLANYSENANAPWVTSDGGQTYTWVAVQNLRGESGIMQSNFRLPGPTVGASAVTTSHLSDWVRFYNYHPGALRTGETNHLSAAGVAQGDPLELAIKSIDSSVAGQLTITFHNPHSIFTEVTQYSTLTTGVTLLDAGNNVIASNLVVKERVNSMTVALFFSGSLGATPTKLKYNPQFSRFRIWAAVDKNVSARIIVSDR